MRFWRKDHQIGKIDNTMIKLNHIILLQRKYNEIDLNLGNKAGSTIKACEVK